MDAVKFLKEKKRMCDLHTHAIGCDFCPLSMHNNETGERCRHHIFNNPEEAVVVVEKWSKEHPVETRQSEFLKMFPDVGLNEHGDITICPHVVDESYECRYESCRKCKKDYWSAEAD